MRMSTTLEAPRAPRLFSSSLRAKVVCLLTYLVISNLLVDVESRNWVPSPQKPLSFPLVRHRHLPLDVRGGSELETIPVTSSTPTTPPVTLGKKLRNLRQRTLPAIILLAGLYAIIHYGKARGLKYLVLCMSPGLYYEATSVVLDNSIVKPPRLAKWWWFIAYSLVTTLPHVLDNSVPRLQLAAYTMVLLGLMGIVLRLNMDPLSSPFDFRQVWSQLATYHLSVLATLLPCATWMATLTSFGQEWVLYVALLVIINDTMAYLFGITLGKHPILPAISPKKTWEGWIGAWVSTLALSYPLFQLWFDDYNRHALVLALFAATLSPFGGFLASTLKRAYGQKDFGDLIAGHGGLIDRLDCQLLTAPFVYFYLHQVKVPLKQ